MKQNILDIFDKAWLSPRWWGTTSSTTASNKRLPALWCLTCSSTTGLVSGGPGVPGFPGIPRIPGPPEGQSDPGFWSF